MICLGKLWSSRKSGNKVVTRDFSPFGERSQQKENDTTSPDEDDSAFTGKDWDEDIGLYYYNAKWYDPEIGRFTSEDSVADDPNLYGYCFENPTNMTDPTGHFTLPTNAIGWASTMISAVAILSGDEKLGAISGAMGMFISANSLMKWIEEHRTHPNRPAPDPADTESNTVAAEQAAKNTDNNGSGGNNQPPATTDTSTEKDSTAASDTDSKKTTDSTSTAPKKPSPKNNSSGVSIEATEKLKKLAKDDPTVQKILDEINGPIVVKLTLVDGRITFTIRGGLQVTIEVLEDVEITKGTISLKFGPDGRISSITDARGNKILPIDKGMIKLSVALAQPTEISFGRNSEFVIKNESLGEMSWNGRPTIFSTTIISKATGQEIKVSIGPNIDVRPPAPQKAPVFKPFAPLPVLPVPLPI